MASLIEGYNYDIFISYRQKDNKYDGWVTEFVENLKKELEATFKEDLSVYFDINPHDGLLESHEVGESLKDKLKCLIFIPIISRTYCDPKSFAWQNELKAFVEKASNDNFGLKIKLPSGNVASRILPIRIYDLNKEDIKLCESEIGGVLRGIEFIYKSAGVNRPLRANEDHAHENLNKTYYRDQINKAANSIQDIVNGIMLESNFSQEIISPNKLNNEPRQRLSEGTNTKYLKPFNNKKIHIGIVVLVVLFAFIAIFSLLRRKSSDVILQKAIYSVDPYSKWSGYAGKIRLRNIRINAESEYNELIEINRRYNTYRRSIISKDKTTVLGIENGSYYREIWSNDNKMLGKSFIGDSIERQDMLFWQEHHICQFGLLMELKNSGLKMRKIAKRINFKGNKCYAIEFKSDSTLKLNLYFKNTDCTVFLDQMDYSFKGYLFESLKGLNAYAVISGQLLINDVYIPMCRNYFLTSDDSFMGIDLITRPD